MKKFLALICTIACIFGLTACGSGETLTDYEQYKTQNAQELADQLVLYLFSQYMDDDAAKSFDEYTSEEIEYVMESTYNLMVDGYAFSSAIDSFHSAKSSMGAITGTNGSTVTISGNQIIVEVDVNGEKKNAKAEVIFSNDMFLKLESASLNPVSGMGELMGKAALNTVIGMGTVFIVLILISFIISCFNVIPKIQANAARKKAAESAGVTGVENAVAQIIEQEQEAAVEETDDLELVAVIAAAVAACEGAASTEGFVVRSIRRRQA